VWVNCLKTLNKLTMYLPGMTPSAPSVSHGQVMEHAPDHVTEHLTDHVTEHVMDHVTEHVMDHVTSWQLNCLAREQECPIVLEYRGFKPDWGVNAKTRTMTGRSHRRQRGVFSLEKQQFYVEVWISSFEIKADGNSLRLWRRYRWELLSLANVWFYLNFLHSFYSLDTDSNFTINSMFLQWVNTPLPPVSEMEESRLGAKGFFSKKRSNLSVTALWGLRRAEDFWRYES